MQTYFEKDYITIGYNKDAHAVVSQWTTPPTSDEFRKALDAILAALEHFKTGKQVSDTTHLGAMHPEDQKWVATDWFEKALKAGYSHLAIIVPSDVFTQMSVEDTFSNVTSPIPYTYFDTMETAIAWIKQF